MKKLLGIVVLSFSLSSCTDVVLELLDERRFINRALYPGETINLMGRKCVCLELNIKPAGIRDNLIGFRDDKLGYIKYRFDLENVQDNKKVSHGNYFVYKNFDVIYQGRWEMNVRGEIFLDGDKNNSMRFHLKQETYRDNNLAVKIENNNYPEGKFFNIDLILKWDFFDELRKFEELKRRNQKS